jgi:nucleotide-binding universal stress UspA family protein
MGGHGSQAVRPAAPDRLGARDDTADPGRPSLVGTVARALREMSARALETAVSRAEEVATGLKITTALLSGPPVLAVAGSGSSASMLVIGARGAGGFAAMILGSVSRYAALRAACPVIVVRQATMAVHHQIAVGVRDPAETGEALTFAFEEAAARHADLAVVHAWSWFPAALRASAGDGAVQASLGLEQISAEAPDGLAAALERWRDKYPGVRVGPEVIRGHPDFSPLRDEASLADTAIEIGTVPGGTRQAWSLPIRSGTRLTA